MGRPYLGYLFDAARTLAPDGIIVFAHGADEKTAEEIRTLLPPGGSVVAGNDDPAVFIGRMLERCKEHTGDILFISAVAAPVDRTLLADFVDAFRRQPETPWRIESVDAHGQRQTRLLAAGAPSVVRIGGKTPDDPDGSFTNRVFRFLDREVYGGNGRQFTVDPLRQPGDVTSPRGFAAALRVARRAVAERLMDDGVTIIDPERTYVDWPVTVGSGTTLYPDTYLEGRTTLGAGCVVGPSAKITDSALGDAVIVKMCSVVTESVVEAGVQIGPFAHIRPKTRLSRNVKIGNFVEVKKSTIGPGSKASHLSYLGDALIGSNVNVGAGTITCNYDGVNKHTTTIGDGVFIGSDTQFIAPVSVGDDSLIGAGSTITKDVPPNSLAVARSKQVNIPGRGVKSRKEHT